MVGEQGWEVYGKDGYRWLLERRGSSGAQMADNGFWKKLWKIRALPKMLNCLWRAATNCFPTRERLFQCRVMNSKLCMVSGNGDESVTHIFLTCAYFSGM